MHVLAGCRLPMTAAACVYCMQALPFHKGAFGKTLYCYELDVRTLAWQ